MSTSNDLTLTLRENKLALEPNSWLEGRAGWNLPLPLKSVEVRLVWFTRGKGTVDANVVETNPVASTLAMGDTPFRFQLPEGPHSFSGSLISLTWAVELLIQPGDLFTRLEFIMAPQGQEIRLQAVTPPPSATQSSFAARKAAWQARRGGFTDDAGLRSNDSSFNS